MKKVLFTLIISLFIGFAVSTQEQVGVLGDKAYYYLSYFDKNGGRPVNTAKEKAAADFIFRELELMGYAPQRQKFSELVKSKKGTNIVVSENIICEKKGTSLEEIIIAAHYDSVSDGNGSDDNASGISILLETCFNLRKIETKYTIKFVFFGAEEVGEVGSKHFVKNLGDEKSIILAMLNYDSLIAGDTMYVHGSLKEKGKIRDWMMMKANELNIKLNIQKGLNKDYPEGTTGDWGDQAPFDKIGIEYAAFEATNWDIGDKDGYTQTDQKYGDKGEIWHSKYDTIAYIDKTFPGRIKEHLNNYEKLLMVFLDEYAF